MYTAHYNLQKKPFQISSDAAFIWLGEKHQEGLATLRYGILDNKGFLVLTGDVGTGKTTLINALIAGLGSDVIYASVPDPSLEKMDFFNYISAAFGIEGEFTSKGKFIFYFTWFLNQAHENNQKVLLIIDEAQLLTQELLEEVRLLSNIVTKDSSPLLNIFFVGQYEFNELIRRPENRAIAQRLTLNYYIEPLTQRETEDYIRHRLKIAGTTARLFDASAIREIFTFSQGFPRRINIICDHCLMSGYAEDKKLITGAIARESAKELTIPVQRKEQPPPVRPIPSWVEIPQPVTSPPPPADPVAPAAPVAPVAQVAPIVSAAQPGKAESPSHVRLVGSVLLIVLILFSCYLVFPDFIKDTWRRAGEYFTAVQNKTGVTGREAAVPQAMPGAQKTQSRTALPAGPEPAAPAGSGPVGKKEQVALAGAVPAEKSQEQQAGFQADGKAHIPVAPGKVKKTVPDQANQHAGQPLSLRSEPAVSDPPSVGGRPDSAERVLQPLPPLPEKPLVLYFENGSNLFDEADVGRMKEFARVLKMYPKVKISVLGYTDSRGDEEYNKQLSAFRADMVRSFLMGQDLAPNQIRAEGLGSKNPIASNATSEGRDLNRRVEIIVEPRH